MNDKIKCPACGKDIKAVAKHCGFCGVKIEAQPAATEVVKTDNANDSGSAYVNPVVIPSNGTRGNNANLQAEAVKEASTDSENAAKAPSGKVCTVCGKKMGMRAKFCGACGGVLTDEREETNPEADTGADVSAEAKVPESVTDTPDGVDRWWVNVCENCKFEVKQGAKFCGKCGGKTFVMVEKTDAVDKKENPLENKVTAKTSSVKINAPKGNHHPDFEKAGDL